MIFPVSYVLLALFSAVPKLGILDRQGGIQFLIVDCMPASTVSDVWLERTFTKPQSTT
jgi:hypothetical protein